MSHDVWAAVDRYITKEIVQPDEALDDALKESVKAGLPAINVSPPQGKLLHILARLQGAKRILEVGTLGGYSTIWLASALPRGGRLVSLELEKAHADVARRNIERAGLERFVEIRLGRAIDTMSALVLEGDKRFDLIFLDADKKGNPDYFRQSLKLSHVGTLIVVDNVIRNGGVIDAKSRDESIQGVRRLNKLIASETRVVATTLQTVGAKGYDGFTLALVVSE